jgi:hypothetical protein
MKTLMKKLFILTMLVTAIAAFTVAAPATAQTPDGETPANEGVCDVLIGSTPGLYGLCVAFCEAQDCEVTYDPSTDEVTFDPDCKPSNPKILENYNRRMQPDDPDMPCVNYVVSECPCWTEEELNEVADANVMLCSGTVGGHSIIYGFDASGLSEGAASGTAGGGLACLYHGVHNGNYVIRNFGVSAEEDEICRGSIYDECTSRGY